MLSPAEPDILEFDLDEGPAAEQVPASDTGSPRSRRGRHMLAALWPRLSWMLAGALVGGVAVHVVHAESAARQAPAVRIALGELGARQLTARVGTTRAVFLSTVAVNDGDQPLVVRGIQAQGAALRLPRTFVANGGAFPLRLGPGETASLPMILTGDCGADTLRTPRITVLVGPSDANVRPVDVDIPDLDTVWQSTLGPSSCAGSA